MRRLISLFVPSNIHTASLKPLLHVVKKTFFAIFGLGLISIVGLIYVDREQVLSELNQFGANTGLKLRYIEVRGRSHITQNELLSALNLQLDAPIFTIDLQKLHKNVSKIGWVKSVIVERHLPSSILITLKERVPIALLQTDSQHQLIDETGAIIYGADPRNFTHLKVVAGDNAAQNVAPILTALQTEPELFSEVWAVSFRSERRWDVHLKNGIEIRLPESDPISAWSRLAVIDREKSITKRDLAVIDLRIAKQLIVEPNIPVRGRGSKT